MSDARELMALDAAVAMLHVRADDTVHTFVQAGPALLGAHWPREQLVEAMRRAPAIDVTGPEAQRLGHGLAIEHNGGTLFIETRTPAEPTGQLSVWTLYDSPRDAPGMYVLRRHEVGAHGLRPTTDAFSSADIEELREIARRMGLHCIERHASDEPQIVESWL